MTEHRLTTALRNRLEEAPDAPFVKCGAQWRTHAQLHHISERVAAGLTALGVEKGDRVALLASNREELIELHLACVKLGAIQVPINFWLKGEPLHHQLRDSGATVLITDSAGHRATAPLIDRTHVRHTVLLDSPDHDPQPTPPLTYDELRAYDARPRTVHIEDADPISIIYTSGTTGPAKGCVLSNRYYLTIGRAFGQANLVIPEDRIFTAWPLFHTSGHVLALTAALINRASACIEQQFSASRFITRAVEEASTVLFGVGPMAAAILAQPPHPNDGRHPFRVSGWVPLPPERQIEFERRFNTPVISEIYGQTECFPVSLSPLDGPRRRGSAGRALPHLDVRVIDDSGEELPPGTTGEIVVRPLEPHTIFSGYWPDTSWTQPGATRQWHHTGDNGQLDHDGFLTFVDRKKDSLRRRGENISSFDLENAILAHPNIAQAAVVGTPAEIGEDDIRACIVLQPGAQLEPAEAFTFFRENLPYYAIPRYVELRDSLPTTAATNRTQKHILRDEGIATNAWDLDSMGFTIPHRERRA